MTSEVKGIKDRNVIILSYQKFNETELKKLMKRFKLDCFYIIRSNKDYAICPKTVSLTRLKKIVNASKSSNKVMLHKFNKVFVPISPIFNMKENEGEYRYEKVIEKPTMVKKIGEENPDIYHSYFHSTHLQSMGFNIPEMNLHGKQASVIFTIKGDQNGRE
jgi:hypothetical protein